MSPVRTRACYTLCGLMLAGCSSITAPDLAPESVAGNIIQLDDRHAQICESPTGSGQWSAWGAFQHGCSLDFPFDANNQYRRGQHPADSTCMTYKKTGANCGEIRYESAEMEHTCYLHFVTPTSGTATKEGYGGDTYYKQRHIQFRIK